MAPSTPALLLTAAIRVAARAAAIQLEDVAAVAALKGKGRVQHRTELDVDEQREAALRSTSSIHQSTTRSNPTASSSYSNNHPGTPSSPSSTPYAPPQPPPAAAAVFRPTPVFRSAPILAATRTPSPASTDNTAASSTADIVPPAAHDAAGLDVTEKPSPTITLAGPEPTPSSTPHTPVAIHETHPPTTASVESHPEVLEAAVALDAESSETGGAKPSPSLPEVDKEDDAPVLRASTVPSSRLGRLFHYGSLAASLSFGAASESIRRTAGGGGQGSVFMSDANVRRLVATLGRMRGAALKLGQFMSIQDNALLPPEIERVLHQVQAHANYMPDWQMERVMVAELGAEWKSHFATFDRTPVASASIGQVHRATLLDGTPVAVKIQFPGVSSSIESDLANISLLLRGSAVLPKGLYLQNTIAVMRRELEDECDYVRESASGKRFERLLAGDDFFTVPRVIDDVTTGKVLTTEWMTGKPLSKMKGMSQETRDLIGTNILRLCLQELFQFRFMQTDPNWANFLFDAEQGRIQLIDFGASREYSKEFMDGWYRLLNAALTGDREAMKVESINLGYLTGEENEIMLDAHLQSMALLASPFRYEGVYEFASQSVTEDVRALIPVMLKHRLTPPPTPTYSLNRKLSGAFLMCAKLGANVDCHALWQKYAAGYQEGPEVDGVEVGNSSEEGVRL